VVVFALALPAFHETEGNWRTQGDFAVTFTDRYGNEIGQRGRIQGDSVPVDEMPDYVIQAVLATEDRRFFEHYGIDFLGLARAMTENMRANSVVQGGSTITQQLAKNIFLTNERTFERKAKEALLSIWLEANVSKKEILQLYLDRAYMGGGTVGLSAAAQFYFGKQIKDLTLAEAAMLAGLFKRRPNTPLTTTCRRRARANEVLTNMVQAGFLTEGQVLSARLKPADIVDRGDTKSPDYFLDWAYEEAKKLGEKYHVHSMVRAPPSTLASSAPRKNPSNITFGNSARSSVSTRARRWSWKMTARCARLSVDATTASASSTARHRPCARPDHPSSRTSTLLQSR
jgi:penicillin-binding protein 1A